MAEGCFYAAIFSVWMPYFLALRRRLNRLALTRLPLTEPAVAGLAVVKVYRLHARGEVYGADDDGVDFRFHGGSPGIASWLSENH